MLVIVNVSRLANDRVEIRVARPQHDANPTQNYASEEQVRVILSGFGIREELIASHLKLLGQMGAFEQLKFPQMDVRKTTCLGTGSPALGNLGREVRNQTLREVGLHNRVRFDW